MCLFLEIPLPLFTIPAVENALAAGADASPPFNMLKSSIFVAVVVCTAALCILFFEGLKETRRALDAAKEREKAENELMEIALDMRLRVGDVAK